MGRYAILSGRELVFLCRLTEPPDLCWTNAVDKIIIAGILNIARCNKRIRFHIYFSILFDFAIFNIS